MTVPVKSRASATVRLGDRSCGEDDDAIGSPYGAQSVSDHDRGPALHEPLQGVLGSASTARAMAMRCRVPPPTSRYQDRDLSPRDG